MSSIWSICVSISVIIQLLSQVMVAGQTIPGHFNTTQYYWLTILSNTPQYIRLAGFEVENHTIATPDGYLLQIYRLVNPTRHTNLNGYAMVLFSGMETDSEIYFANSDGFFRQDSGVYYEYENSFQNEHRVECPPGREPVKSGRNLPFSLANCGYDVWFTSRRDSRSRASHVALDPDRDSIYWNINLDKYTIDAKAILEYILQIKQAKSLGVSCHSITCPVIFQLLADFVQFNTIIKPFFNLGPFVYTQHLLSIPLTLPALLEPIYRKPLESSADLRPILPYLSNKAHTNTYTRIASLMMYTAIGGLNPWELDVSRNYRFFAHSPSTVAVRVYAHIGQRRLSGTRLYKFDYGTSQENLLEYGTPTPPEYNMSLVTNPYIVVFNGSLDTAATPLDIEQLRRSISVPFYRQIQTDLSHMDMVLGLNVNITINLPILQILHGLGLDIN